MWLQEKNISYEERKISNPSIRKELMVMGHHTTPVTIINETVVVGFSPPKLAAALGLE